MIEPIIMTNIQAHVYQHVALRAAEIVDMQNMQDPEFMQIQQMIMSNATRNGYATTTKNR